MNVLVTGACGLWLAHLMSTSSGEPQYVLKGPMKDMPAGAISNRLCSRFSQWFHFFGMSPAN